MANLSLKAHNFCSLSPTTSSHPSIFNCNYRRFHFLRFLPHERCLEYRVSCSIKEKENVKESEIVPKVLTGLRVDELEQKSSITGTELGNGFGWNWPPWRNIPESYKFIGPTSLAFVICNMDKKSSRDGSIDFSLPTGLVPFLAGFMPGLILSRILVGIGEGVSPSAATDLIARHAKELPYYGSWNVD